jgi:hypothetical protein
MVLELGGREDKGIQMKTPELLPIEYRPTFRLDSSGLVVGTATQDEWDAAVQEFRDARGILPVVVMT